MYETRAEPRIAPPIFQLECVWRPNVVCSWAYTIVGSDYTTRCGIRGVIKAILEIFLIKG